MEICSAKQMCLFLEDFIWSTQSKNNVCLEKNEWTKKIWDIKIPIWQYTICGSFASGIENDEVVMKSKNDPTFLVHITSLVNN